MAGTAGEQSVEIAVIYTTLGDHSADCVYVSSSPISEPVSAKLRSLRVTNGQPPYRTLMGHRSELGCRRLILTHMSEDMLRRLGSIEAEWAGKFPTILPLRHTCPLQGQLSI